MRSTLFVVLVLGFFAVSTTAGCAKQSDGGGGSGAGGTSNTGGTGGTGGTGSNVSSGGTGSSGAAGSGGAIPNGGASGSGGSKAAGGSAGSAGSGGSISTGGSSGVASGGAGGAGNNGGGSGTGGTAAGGSAGSGGSSAAGGNGTGGNATGGALAGGSSGNGGGSGTCSSAFFSSDAASRVAAEYDSWTKAYVQDCPANNSAVVKNGGGVVSEGIGYGMLLAANNNDQKLFDKLWKFYTDHLDKKGLMNWSMDACASPGDNGANAASDGDLDAAMGLIVANKVWGGYADAAKNLIGKIKDGETDTCPNGLVVLRPGDAWGGCSDSSNMGKVNPSYFSPGHYRAFATVDTANADFWLKLAADSYTLLAQYQDKMNGLVPEWGYNDGRVEGDYGYNACRTPWRVAMDYMWNCTPEAKTFLQKVASFIDSKGGVASTGYPAGESTTNSAFMGAFVDSGIAVSQAKIDGYVKDWMAATLADTPYFQATLRRLYLMVAGGKMQSGR
jgi:endo-1,4-beta-D-glucanase Y